MTDRQPRRPKTARKDAPRLRGGVMKRGNTWSYVIRVKDPATGVSKPRWVGGFPTEEAAKGARDESRVKARRGEYVDRNRITVAAYLDDWIDSHAMEIKPRTLQDYRACLRLYVTPRIGHLQVQAVRPSTITKLYRDLLTGGGRDSQPLAVATVTHLHAVLRKAFRDAVIVDEIISSNPVERAKRPRAQAPEAGTVWTVAQLRAFLATARQHRLFACFHVAALPEPGAASCSTSAGPTSTSTPGRSLSPARPPSSRVSGSTGPPRAAWPASSPSTRRPLPCCGSTKPTRPLTSSTLATPGAASATATCLRPAGASPSTPTP